MLTKSINANECITILHQNIRSISKNIDELLTIMSQFQNCFDVIVLTQTWKIENSSLYKIPDYVIYTTDKCSSDFAHEYLESLTEKGYVSLINDITRENKNCKICINHVFTNTLTKQTT